MEGSCIGVRDRAPGYKPPTTGKKPQVDPFDIRRSAGKDYGRGLCPAKDTKDTVEIKSAPKKGQSADTRGPISDLAAGLKETLSNIVEKGIKFFQGLGKSVSEFKALDDRSPYRLNKKPDLKGVDPFDDRH